MPISFIKNRKIDIITAFLLAIFIITFSIVVTLFFKPLYAWDIGFLHLSETTGLSYEVIMKNYDILIQYQSLFYQGTLSFPDFAMSATGQIHFAEVKKIFEMIQVICLLSGVISFFLAFYHIRHKEYRFLRLTSLFSVAIPLLIGFLAAIDFNRLFILFHQLVFRNDYWIFDESTDPIITILPETFFMHCLMMIVALVFFISAVVYWVYRQKKKAILKDEDIKNAMI